MCDEQNCRKRLLVIAPPLLLPSYRARWKQLANTEPFSWTVRALVPENWRNRDYGEERIFRPEPETDENFELKPVATTSMNNRWYKICRLRHEIADFKPDIIFCVHHEGIAQLRQTILTRWLFFRDVRLIYFSMTAFPRVPPLAKLRPKEFLKHLYFRLNWWLIRHGTDGALCHYDRIEEQMRKEGYKKPILRQTQYGVDPEQFKPDPEKRVEMRKMFGFTGTVVGFCGRFVDEKGLRELMKALEGLGNIDWQLLLIGDGPLRPEVEDWARNRGFEDRIRIPGYVPHDRVQNYFQAMDIFYLGSKDTPKYIDTFPLVVAQAMTMGLPVIGSSAGAIPYQLADLGFLFPDGNSDKLREHFETLIPNSGFRLKCGNELRKRALKKFSIQSMNKVFYDFTISLQ